MESFTDALSDFSMDEDQESFSSALSDFDGVEIGNEILQVPPRIRDPGVEIGNEILQVPPRIRGPALAPAEVCWCGTRCILDLHYSPETPDGLFMFSAAKDKIAVLWDGEKRKKINIFSGHRGAVYSCCLDTKAEIAATASADCHVKIWDAKSGAEKLSIEHASRRRACSLSEDKNWLVSGGHEKLLSVFDLNKPDFASQELTSPGCVQCAKWLHSESNIIASSCMDKSGIRLHDLRTDGEVIHTLKTQKAVRSFEVSRNGKYLMACDGSRVKIWEELYYDSPDDFKMPCNVNSASVEPVYGKTFVAAGDDMHVHMCNFRTGKEIECHRGHHGIVNCIRFAPNGETVASASEDGTIRFWPHSLDHAEIED